MRIKRWAISRLRRALRSDLNQLVTKAEARAMVQSAYLQAESYYELRLRLPEISPSALREYAISPDAAVHLIDVVETQKPQVVVELGSGSSTLILAAALRRWVPGGRLVSVDHSPEYADLTRVMLSDCNLDNAEVRVSELDSSAAPHGPGGWYGIGAFDDLSQIDLLLIDGPPASANDRTRWPSFEVLSSLVREGGVVLIDDTNRNDERDLAVHWAGAVQGDLVHLDAEKGLARVTYPR